jgi:hypothetical protein
MLIYLSKYSPDLNPIELAFSKLKAHLRKAAEHTIPRLLRRIGRVVGFQRAGMQELFSPCGLCSNLTGFRSSWRCGEGRCRIHQASLAHFVRAGTVLGGTR